MLHRSVFSSAIVLGVLVMALPGQAQSRRPPPAGAETETPEVLPPADEGSGGGNGPASDVPERRAPSTPAAGYAYGDRRSKGRAKAHARYRTKGPVVNLPGFEQTADGGSRLFVQLSENVPVEERKAQGTLTYVLKGASPRVWNNTNALVTVHFSTPVSRARLVPHGQDLHFVVELRAAATPAWKMTEGADKSAMLTIDFPKGDYLQTAAAPPPADGEATRPTSKSRGKRTGRKAAPPPKAAAPAAPPP